MEIDKLHLEVNNDGVEVARSRLGFGFRSVSTLIERPVVYIYIYIYIYVCNTYHRTFHISHRFPLYIIKINREIENQRKPKKPRYDW